MPSNDLVSTPVPLHAGIGSTRSPCVPLPIAVPTFGLRPSAPWWRAPDLRIPQGIRIHNTTCPMAPWSWVPPEW